MKANDKLLQEDIFRSDKRSSPINILKQPFGQKKPQHRSPGNKPLLQTERNEHGMLGQKQRVPAQFPDAKPHHGLDLGLGSEHAPRVPQESGQHNLLRPTPFLVELNFIIPEGLSDKLGAESDEEESVVGVEAEIEDLEDGGVEGGVGGDEGGGPVAEEHGDFGMGDLVAEEGVDVARGVVGEEDAGAGLDGAEGGGIGEGEAVDEVVAGGEGEVEDSRVFGDDQDQVRVRGALRPEEAEFGLETFVEEEVRVGLDDAPDFGGGEAVGAEEGEDGVGGGGGGEAEAGGEVGGCLGWEAAVVEEVGVGEGVCFFLLRRGSEGLKRSEGV